MRLQTFTAASVTAMWDIVLCRVMIVRMLEAVHISETSVCF
jgi:hypothetical protein